MCFIIGDEHQFIGHFLIPLDPCKLSEICPHESMAKKQNQLIVIPMSGYGRFCQRSYTTLLGDRSHLHISLSTTFSPLLMHYPIIESFFLSFMLLYF